MNAFDFGRMVKQAVSPMYDSYAKSPVGQAFGPGGFVDRLTDPKHQGKPLSQLWSDSQYTGPARAAPAPRPAPAPAPAAPPLNPEGAAAQNASMRAASGRALYDAYAKSPVGRAFGPGGIADLATDPRYRNRSWGEIWLDSAAR